MNKLMNIVRPDIAIFGQKDYQQYILIKDMVQQLFTSIDIVLAPIIRENDGLAMSSRNSYLNPDQRSKAVYLYESLVRASKKIQKNAGDYMSILDTEIQRLNKDDLYVDYLELRKTDNLSNVEDYKNISGQYILLGAIRLGETRLIDNIIL